MTENGGTILWRLQSLEERANTLQNEKATKDDVRNIKEDVRDLTTEVHSLRKALVIFSLSSIGTAIMFLVGVLAVIAHS